MQIQLIPTILKIAFQKKLYYNNILKQRYNDNDNNW